MESHVSLSVTAGKSKNSDFKVLLDSFFRPSFILSSDHPSSFSLSAFSPNSNKLRVNSFGHQYIVIFC